MDIDRRLGELLPVPEPQLRVLHAGERLFGPGGFEIATRLATPPTTWPTCTLTTATATTPPDADVAARHESIERVAA